jgi:2-oxoglutarate ferredoxin oxidoreductase subunit alpha
MAKLLRMEFPEYATRVVSLAHSDGLPLTARWLVDEIVKKEQ